jgi:hypothetical protein
LGRIKKRRKNRAEETYVGTGFHDRGNPVRRGDSTFARVRLGIGQFPVDLPPLPLFLQRKKSVADSFLRKSAWSGSLYSPSRSSSP